MQALLCDQLRNTLSCQFEIAWFDLISNRVSTYCNGCDSSAGGPCEGIKDCITRKRKHADKPLCQFDRVRSWMTASGGRTLQIGPYRPPPSLHFDLGKHGKSLLNWLRF